MIKNVKMGRIEVKSQCIPIENKICILTFTEGVAKYKKLVCVEIFKMKLVYKFKGGFIEC